jgi:hypothetical protein
MAITTSKLRQLARDLLGGFHQMLLCPDLPHLADCPLSTRARLLEVEHGRLDLAETFLVDLYVGDSRSLHTAGDTREPRGRALKLILERGRSRIRVPPIFPGFAGSVRNQIRLATLGEGQLDHVEVARGDGRLEGLLRLLDHLAHVVAG